MLMNNLTQYMWQHLNCLAVNELVDMIRHLVFPSQQRAPQLHLDCIPQLFAWKANRLLSALNSQDTI